MKHLQGHRVMSRGLVVFLFSFISLLAPSTSTSALVNSTLQNSHQESPFDSALFYYNQGDWPKAAIYFQAYIYLSSDEYRNNSKHRKQVTDALDFSLKQIYWWKSSLASCKSTCQSQQGRSQQGPVGHTPPGVGGQTYMPRVDPLPPTPQSYLLVCRGGGPYKFGVTSRTTVSSKTHLFIRINKGQRGVGMNAEYRGELLPGECSWRERRISDNEPSLIIVLPPLFNINYFDFTWTNDNLFRVGSNYEYLNVLQEDSQRYVIFAVYDDSKGHFLVTEVLVPDW